MNLHQYIEQINKRFMLGNTTEHTFRGDLQTLIESLIPNIIVTNEPQRVACGSPDYVISAKKLPIGYIEAKDIGDKDLLGNGKNKEQFDRYKNFSNNFIFTDYLTFHFFKNKELSYSFELGTITGNKIQPNTPAFVEFEMQLKRFCEQTPEKITSPTKLAELMAEKTKFIAYQIEKALDSDEENNQNSQLQAQLRAFRRGLINDLSHKAFADMYAQTIAYGLFAARYHDPTLQDFSREEAARLIPISNPFLRKLFQQIAGYDLDTRIDVLVDDLVGIFLATDIKEIMHDFGKSTQQEDPVIYFYETFLSFYDPALRKAKGVWYTPPAVVQFIVRAVDDVLKQEFNLKMGLADSSKVTTKIPHTDAKGKQTEISKEYHKVQILDPATGTGTFLSEVIQLIYKKFAGQKGIWKKYVENDLMPRLNGFELLMASYTMAHLKLDILLNSLNFQNENNKRFNVFLTNSLEEGKLEKIDLFTQFLSEEANEANQIKQHAPVMCVIGNPPYSVSSSNKSVWIEKLVADYKKDLNEKNIQPLSDDYIKFLRYGQHFIDKNGAGVLAYISNNSFLDGLIHRQMRKHLLQSFDKIYILDLHGNAKKKETAPDGSPDMNVFDIMQGVSINIFIKTGKKPPQELGEVYHLSLQGKRDFKYQTLQQNTLASLPFQRLEYSEPNYFFVPKNFENSTAYEKGFKMDELFPVYNTGIETGRDTFFIDFDKKSLIQKVNNAVIQPISEEVINRYQIKNTNSFKLRDNIGKATFNESCIKKILYRPFDIRFNYYDIKLQRRPSFDTMKKMSNKNFGLVTSRQCVSDFKYVFLTDKILDRNLLSQAAQFGAGFVFPLYLYPENKGQLAINSGIDGSSRVANLDMRIVGEIARGLGIKYMDSIEKPQDKPKTPLLTKEGQGEVFSPLHLLDYIYAVLHSPRYREEYKEFLKIDFPRVPYPTKPEKFWQLVQFGGELRGLHLLESDKLEDYITEYPEDGTNIVTKPRFVPSTMDKSVGAVYINDSQYFNNVPLIAWEFYIGGYQPAQKWLKDRKDRELDIEDILHYQKIILALTETNRIMQEIDRVGV